MRKINWNDRVTLHLNEHGCQIYKEYFSKLGIEPPRIPLTEHRTTMELWQAAQIFGPHLYSGCQLPFESTDMEIQR